MVFEELIEEFMKYDRPDWKIMKIYLKDIDDSRYTQLSDYFSSLNDIEVKEYLQENHYLFNGEPEPKKEKMARYYLGKEKILKRITTRRFDYLREINDYRITLPYNHPELEVYPIDENSLIDISIFDTTRGNLEIGDHVFHILPSLSSTESIYWTMLALKSLISKVNIRIRLDPFIINKRKGFQSPFYKMMVYGKVPSWDDIENLDGELHSRYYPDEPLLSPGVEFTDVYWKTRGNNVHFQCEEVPTIELHNRRGSRYFHSIFDKSKKKFIHIDGAIRIFSEKQLMERISTHVRKAGKIGKRIKLFLIDGILEKEIFLKILYPYFVWNNDVPKHLIEKQDSS